MSRAAKGADCKSAGYAFAGSSPASPTIFIFWTAKSRGRAKCRPHPEERGFAARREGARSSCYIPTQSLVLRDALLRNAPQDEGLNEAFVLMASSRNAPWRSMVRLSFERWIATSASKPPCKGWWRMHANEPLPPPCQTAPGGAYLRQRGCSSMVEQQPSKLNTRVRFPSPAPF